MEKAKKASWFQKNSFICSQTASKLVWICVKLKNSNNLDPSTYLPPLLPSSSYLPPPPPSKSQTQPSSSSHTCGVTKQKISGSTTTTTLAAEKLKLSTCSFVKSLSCGQIPLPPSLFSSSVEKNLKTFFSFSKMQVFFLSPELKLLCRICVNSRSLV